MRTMRDAERIAEDYLGKLFYFALKEIRILETQGAGVSATISSV